jgi:hypothetical protein
VSNVASRLCDEAKSGQILISPRVLTKVENAMKVEPVGEFELKGDQAAAGGVQRACSDVSSAALRTSPAQRQVATHHAYPRRHLSENYSGKSSRRAPSINLVANVPITE